MTGEVSESPDAPRGENSLSHREYENEVKSLKPSRSIAHLSSGNQHTVEVMGPI